MTDNQGRVLTYEQVVPDFVLDIAAMKEAAANNPVSRAFTNAAVGRVIEALEAQLADAYERAARVAEQGVLPCDIGGDLILDIYTAETIAAAIRALSEDRGRFTPAPPLPL